MFNQYGGANTNEHNAAKNFRTLARDSAHNATDHHADGHHDEGCETDGCSDRPDVDVEKGQSHTHHQGVDAGGEAGKGEQPEPMTAGFLPLLRLRRLEAFKHHAKP